jgi:hypothetical protein
MKALAVALAASVLAFAGVARATTFIDESGPAADGSLSWDLGDDGGIPLGNFIEDFTLTLPADGFTAAGVEATFTSPSNDLTFSLVTLGGLPFSLLSLPSENLGNFPAHVFAGGPITLEVQGHSPGPAASYDGHVTFTPVAVPEPASWALMILGFGATGALLRHRRRAVTFA